MAYLELENPELYQKLVKHIKIETLFPKYALCTLHESTYTQTELRKLRLDFKAVADELGLVEQKEHGNISDVYKQWGIQ